MAFVIALLTMVMVLDCIVLVFLVLIQLPKKEAGAGLAFGAAATDALFGAGSGTVLTKITKYAATTFFVLAVILSIMQRAYHTRTGSAFVTKLAAPAPPAASAPVAPPPATPTINKPAAPPAVTPPATSTNTGTVPTLESKPSEPSAPASTNTP